MSNGKLKLPARRLIVLAVVAGAFAGGIAVYVMGGADGNRAPAGASGSAAVAEADKARCEARADKAGKVGAAATGAVAAMMAADPPQSVAGLAFTGPGGEKLTLADFAGKTVLMNLWATWCVPCREEMPALDRLQAEMGSDRFQVVAVNVDTGDEARPKKFMREIGADSLPLYRDSTLALFNEAKKRGLALGLPVTLLIDPDGCLLANMNGPADWASADARAFLQSVVDMKG